MARADLTIMGAGIFGLSCAWAAAQRGARVRVLERDRIGAGASGGLVGALAPHVPEQWNPKKQFQLESLLVAGDWWREVEAVSGLRSGYARTGRLQPLADERVVAQAQSRAGGAAEVWRDRAEWRVTNDPGPFAPESPTGLWLWDSLTARLHPRMAAAALVAAIRAKGGEVVEGVAEPDGDGPTLWATGVDGLDALSHDLRQEIGNAEKGQALSLRFAAPDQPQLFADGLHIVPHADGTIAIGSTSERQWDDPASTDGQLEALHLKALSALPVLREAPVIERWAGLRPRTRSRAPMLGEWPGRPNHYIANGGFKIGFGMAPKVAEVMADLILDGKDTIPDAFRVEASLKR